MAITRRLDGHAAGALRRAWPLCWVCLRPISSDVAFPVRFGALGHRNQRPFSAFGLCPSHRDPLDRPVYVGIREREDRYACHAISHRGLRLRVIWQRSASYKPTPLAKALHREMRVRGMACVCGRPATEVGHVIPRYWVCLNGHPPRAADFEGNLAPSCGECNRYWCTRSPFDPVIQRHWTSGPSAFTGWSSLLESALVRAREIGLRLYVPPSLDMRVLPGQPVLVPPANPEGRTFEVVAFVDLYWPVRVKRSRDLGWSSPTFLATARGMMAPFLTPLPDESRP